MLKKLGILSLLGLFGCVPVSEYNVGPGGNYHQAPQQQLPEYQSQDVEQPRLRVPNSLVVCRSKQCAPAKLSTSKEYVYNTLLHMLDSNARKKALVCEADDNTHACTQEYLSVPIKVGVTPAYMYVDDVKITDINISSENSSALDLMLNWNVTYNGQTPICRPSKTLLYVKNSSNVIMEDNGYTCKLTTIGTSSIKTLFAIDYIDLDYGYIGGYYSIGMSGPAFGGGSGYMILRLPEDISLDPKDFQPVKLKDKESEPLPQALPEAQTNPFAPQPVIPVGYVAPVAQPVGYAPAAPAAVMPESIAPAENTQPEPVVNKIPAPNVDTIIRYNHPSKDYDEAKAEMELKRKKEAEDYAKWKKEQEEAINYEGVKVLPLPLKKTDTAVAPADKNKAGEYSSDAENKEIPGSQIK